MAKDTPVQNALGWLSILIMLAIWAAPTVLVILGIIALIRWLNHG